MLKARKYFIVLIALNAVIILSIFTGCAQIKNDVKNLLGQIYNAQSGSEAGSEDEAQPSREAPTQSPSAKASSSEINIVAVKPVAGGAKSGAVTVTTMDEFTGLVVSHAEQGSDITANLQGSIQKDGIIDKVTKIIDDYGYSGYISGIEYSMNKSTLYVRLNYKGGKEQFLSHISAVNSKVQAIVTAVIKSGMSEYDKELTLHDYVVNKVKYDYQNLQNDTIPDDSFTAYGALIKGTAVCQGYAESMYRLLNKAGVKCMIISGSGNNVPHAWNLVSIGGVYYHLDTTFDDPVSSSGDVLSYNYFNLPDDEMSKNHSWDAADYPKCSSNAANYFVINKLTANNKSEFYNIVKKGLLNKLEVIRCKTAAYDPQTYSPDIISKILRDNPGINYMDLKSGYSYDYDQNSYVMDFYIKYK